MRKMRVCCNAYILLYCRFYWLPVRFTRKNEMYNDGDNSNNNNKKAKKPPIIHESSGSRLQIPRAGRIMMVVERLPAARCVFCCRFPSCHHCIAASRVRMGLNRPELASCQRYCRAHGHRKCSPNILDINRRWTIIFHLPIFRLTMACIRVL